MRAHNFLWYELMFSFCSLEKKEEKPKEGHEGRRERGKEKKGWEAIRELEKKNKRREEEGGPAIHPADACSGRFAGHHHHSVLWVKAFGLHWLAAYALTMSILFLCFIASVFCYCRQPSFHLTLESPDPQERLLRSLTGHKYGLSFSCVSPFPKHFCFYFLFSCLISACLWTVLKIKPRALTQRYIIIF